jgi:hypothetical protein
MYIIYRDSSEEWPKRENLESIDVLKLGHVKSTHLPETCVKVVDTKSV